MSTIVQLWRYIFFCTCVVRQYTEFHVALKTSLSVILIKFMTGLRTTYNSLATNRSLFLFCSAHSVHNAHHHLLFQWHSHNNHHTRSALLYTSQFTIQRSIPSQLCSFPTFPHSVSHFYFQKHYRRKKYSTKSAPIVVSFTATANTASEHL